MARDTGFAELEQVIDGLDDFNGIGPDSIHGTLPRVLDRLFEQEILPDVKRRASRHVGEHVNTIDDTSLGWDGQHYRHGLGSSSVVVNSHEYGSGRFNTQGGGFGSSGGYRIPARTSDGPLRFVSNGQEIVVDYVIHPGVKPKRFMQRGVESKADDVAEEVADELEDALERQINL